MKKLILALLISQSLLVQAPLAQKPDNGKPAAAAADTQKAPKEKGERHEFVIANFKTESGVTLPQARIVYGTYGHLNAARDNAVGSRVAWILAALSAGASAATFFLLPPPADSASAAH